MPAPIVGDSRQKPAGPVIEYPILFQNGAGHRHRFRCWIAETSPSAIPVAVFPTIIGSLSTFGCRLSPASPTARRLRTLPATFQGS